MEIYGRKIGRDHPPLIIAEIGINHDGSLEKAIKMIDDAASCGCECVKFQSHVIEDEMSVLAKDIIPGNAKESIWDIMNRCAFSKVEEAYLKQYVESKGMIFLSTPFSRMAAYRLNNMGVVAYKIGSGECNNYPLIKHIASFNKPVILSTGMNDINSIKPAVDILRERNIKFALLHCTSMYPTPYENIRLGAMVDLKENFPDAVIGLSDHSLGISVCLAAVALGASIIEKHFTSDKAWSGPDVPISIDPSELKELIDGSLAVYKALGGSKQILSQEQPTIDFAYACVVAIRDIAVGEIFNEENIWVKRPGTGEIKAASFDTVLGRKAGVAIKKDMQIKWSDVL